MDDFSAPTEPPVVNPDQRVARCAFCKYNLADQTEFYVPDYHLMAVKCPECGRPQPAGVVAEPWKMRRLKQTVLGTLWWLLFFVLTFGTSGALYGISKSTAFVSTVPLAKVVSGEYVQADESYRTNAWGGDINPAWHISSEWWDEVGQRLVRSNYSEYGLIDWSAGFEWLWFLLICPVSGQLLFWLLKKSNPAIRIIVLTGILLFGAFLVLVFTATYGYASFLLSPHQAAIQLVGNEVALVSYIVGATGLLLGYLLAPNMSKALHRVFPSSPRPR